MGVFGEFKEIGDFLQKIGNHELYQKLIAIEEKDLEIMDTNRELRETVDKLKEDLKVKGSLEVENDVYWLIKENGTREEIPYCLHCYDSEKLLMHLITTQSLHMAHYECPKCKLLVDKPGRKKPEQQKTPHDDTY